MLRARGSRFRIRWDRAHGSYRLHQKSWVIDAGHSTETAFVGGINLTAANMGSPGHRLYQRIARENWLRGKCRDFNWQGPAFALSPSACGSSS
jgi:phosphatidylserine/phosphatidylglycerophosphate/cardiolipin synthase-like enzyme